MTKEELIKFWKSSAYRSRSRNFSKDSSTLQDRTFTGIHSLAHISRKPDNIFMKILPQMYLLTRKLPLNIRSHLDLESKSGLQIGLRIGRGLRSDLTNIAEPGVG